MKIAKEVFQKLKDALHDYETRLHQDGNIIDLRDAEELHARLVVIYKDILDLNDDGGTDGV